MQVDFDGKVLWRFDRLEHISDPGEKPRWLARQHHDYQRQGNPVGYYTPGQMHSGAANECVTARAIVLVAAYVAHPERFPNGVPKPQPLPTEVWINKPKPILAQ